MMLADFMCPDCGEMSTFDWQTEDTFKCPDCGAEWDYAVDEGSDGSIILEPFERIAESSK